MKVKRPNMWSTLTEECELMLFDRGLERTLKYLDIVEQRPILSTNPSAMQAAIDYRKEVRTYIEQLAEAEKLSK